MKKFDSYFVSETLSLDVLQFPPFSARPQQSVSLATLRRSLPSNPPLSSVLSHTHECIVTIMSIVKRLIRVNVI